MKLRPVWVLLGVVGAGVAVAVAVAADDKEGAKRSAYSDANYGFRFEPPAFPKAGPKQTVVPIIISAPAEKGFSSNVNVSIQAVATTRKDYKTTSLAQFQQLGLRVKGERDVTVSGRDAVRWEYEGTIQGRALRFLSLAVIDKGRVVLVTCTARQEAFGDVEPEFKACLDSFRLDGKP